MKKVVVALRGKVEEVLGMANDGWEEGGPDRKWRTRIVSGSVLETQYIILGFDIGNGAVKAAHPPQKNNH